jgi:hypothetical protein
MGARIWVSGRNSTARFSCIPSAMRPSPETTLTMDRRLRVMTSGVTLSTGSGMTLTTGGSTLDRPLENSLSPTSKKSSGMVSAILCSPANCGLLDTIDATALYHGRDNISVDINSDGTCNDFHDLNSVVGFGDLPNEFLAATCTFLLFPGDDFAGTSDTRFNKVDREWAAEFGAGCSNRWSIEAVQTHEKGHTFGLGHVKEIFHKWLTMSKKINGPCQNTEATLGWGDWIALDFKY